MTQVITTTIAPATAKITCSHGGTVTIPASQTLLTIDGNAVLVQGDEAKAAIEGCTNTNATEGQTPCKKITPVSVGIATKLKVGGKPVLLQIATGNTDSTPTPPGTWNVTNAGQTKLDAI